MMRFLFDGHSCRDQEKKLAELEMELSATKSQGFRPMIELSGNASTGFGGKLLAVVGIMTTFGTRSRRESIRKTWPEGETFFFFFVYFLVCFFPISLSPFSLSLAPFHSWDNQNILACITGSASKKLEDGKGVVIRFVIGRRFSPSHIFRRRSLRHGLHMVPFLWVHRGTFKEP